MEDKITAILKDEFLSADIADQDLNANLGNVVKIEAKDYNRLNNKPQINGMTLQGNKSALELGLVPSDLSKLEAVEQPTKSVRQTADMFVDNNGKPSKIALQQVKGMATKVVYANELGNVDFEKLDIDDYVILGDKIYRVVDAENNIKQLLPETSAEHVTFADKQGEYTSTNVEDALAEVMDIAKTGGVTGVKGDAETEYRKGNVNITKENIGLGNVDNTADKDKPISNAQAAAIQSIQDNVADIISGAQTVGKATQVKYPLNLSGNVSVRYDGSHERMIDFSRDSFHTNWNANIFGVELKNTGVTKGTYNGITVDAKGRVTAAEDKNYASKQYVQEGLAGKSRSIAFADYQAFVTAVNGYGNTTLKVSDNVFVKTLGVPDMWVTAVNSEKAAYTYTNDQAIVNALNTTNGLTVGYYTFSQLETTKVDLTSYQQKTDDSLNTTNKTVVGAINEIKGTADNAVQSFEAEATIDNTTGTPTVDVVKSGEGTAPTYTFNFKHLKGTDGQQGEAGLVYNKLYSSTINPDIVGSQTITIPTSDFNRTPKTNETFILFNQHGYYLEAAVSSITVENNIQVAKCLIVPSKAVNINGTNGIDGKDALVYTELFFGDISADDTWGLSLANFNRTPRVGERFIFFTTKNQYALMSVEKLYGDGMVAAGVYDHSSQYIVSTKGQDGVGVTNATVGTPVIDDEKTTTPITFSLSDGTTKEVNVEAQNGKDGAQGIGVKSITSGTPTVVNDKTNTPITITLTDNTTVDLVVSAENGKDGTSATVTIVQATGQSTTAVMSQKAVTDELNKKASTSEVNAKYTKPSDGIPKSDLASSVQTSLGKADTALQSAPVTSVNGKTGAVQLGASDVGALPTSTKYVVSVNGESGEVKNIAKTNSANTFTGDQTVTGNGSVSGNFTVGGNLTINGTTTTVDSTTLQVKDKLIEVAHGNTTTLTTPAGLVAPKYDGTNSGALVFDSTGTAYVGDVKLDSTGNIDVSKSELQPLATRTGLVGGNLVQYDSTALTLKDSGKKISDFATAAQGSNADSALTKANANATEISNIKNGTTKVKSAEHADTADSATSAGTATKATEAMNVTENIKGHAIADIFESDGTTVKKATSAGTADKVANGLTIANATFDGSKPLTIGTTGEHIEIMGGSAASPNRVSIGLKYGNLMPSSYNKVTIDGYGIVVDGENVNYLTSHQDIKKLNTNNTTAQDANASEAIAGTGAINLHKIAKTGSYGDLNNKPNLARHSSTQLETNTDLNTLNSSDKVGWYHVGGGNSCAHKPTGVDAFGLEVGRSAEGWFYQVLTSSNASTSRGRRFMRTYSGTAWDGWTKVAITSEIPAVNNGTLTIQKNGTTVATFSANQSGNATANITVPTFSLDGTTLTITTN